MVLQQGIISYTFLFFCINCHEMEIMNSRNLSIHPRKIGDPKSNSLKLPKREEESKLSQLLNTIRYASAEMNEIEVFDKTIPNESSKKMADHILRFFNPAQRIVPRHYKRTGKSQIDEDFIGHVNCYTHTLSLNGTCWILCDKIKLWPCKTS